MVNFGFFSWPSRGSPEPVPEIKASGKFQYQFFDYEAITEPAFSVQTFDVGGIRCQLVAVPETGPTGANEFIGFYLSAKMIKDDSSHWNIYMDADFALNSTTANYTNKVVKCKGTFERDEGLLGSEKCFKKDEYHKKIYSDGGAITVSVDLKVGDLQNTYTTLQARMISMLKDRRFSDLNLVVQANDERTVFPCHMNVVASESKVLREAIAEAKEFLEEHEDDEIEQKVEVEIAGVSPEGLEAWLVYVYTTDDYKIRRSLPIAYELLMLANNHGMPDLKLLCLDTLSNLVTQSPDKVINVNEALNLFRVLRSSSNGDNGLGPEASKNLEDFVLRAIKEQLVGESPAMIEFIKEYPDIATSLLQKLLL